MKPILGFVALFAWLPHCPNIDLPEGPHHHPGHHASDAGSSDAGSEVTLDANSAEDAAIPSDAAADGGEDAAQPEGDDAAVIDANPDPVTIPEVECDTGELGLYEGKNCDEQHLARGIQRYVPRFPLWSDGAVKDRYIYLPEDKAIDTSNVDRWAFPVGTRLYKTFSVKGIRVETRVLEKRTEGVGLTAWDFSVYLWSADQRSAIKWDDVQTMKGVPNALATMHDVPSRKDCESCHTMKFEGPAKGTAVDGDIVNGFGAIQLNWTPPEEPGRPRPITLDGLLFSGQRLRNGATGSPNVFAADANLPGSEAEQNALGYLHANCGNCHGGAAPRADLLLWARVNVRTVQEMPAFKSACGQCLQRWYNKPNKEIGGDPYKLRLVPGHADQSGIIGRMAAAYAIDDLANNPMGYRNLRVPADQMPKSGTEFVDEHGLKQVRAWIDGMAPDACKLPTTECPPPPPPMMTMAPSSTPATP